MFDLYAVMLMFSGALLIIIGAGVSGQSKVSRILNVVIGAAFFGYGFYLEFLFAGGSYRVFLYAFLAPILLIIQTFKARKQATAARQASASLDAPTPAAPAQPNAQPAPVPHQPDI
jgi:predicted lipid-binding transport protein (Tim44 family)